MISYIPQPEYLEGKVKSLVIIDDFDFKEMSKNDRKALSRLCGYASTHKNYSVILCTQTFYDIPSAVRNMANIIVIWDSHNRNVIKSLAQRIGFRSPQELTYLMDKYVKGQHGNLWIDFTANSPATIRINGYQLLDEEDQIRFRKI